MELCLVAGQKTAKNKEDRKRGIMETFFARSYEERAVSKSEVIKREGGRVLRGREENTSR